MILTNPKVVMNAKDLELRAINGCPIAQEEMQKKCMQGARHLSIMRRRFRLTMQEAIRETKIN